MPKFYEPNLRAGFVLKFKSCGITHVMSHDFRGVGVPYMDRGREVKRHTTKLGALAAVPPM